MEKRLHILIIEDLSSDVELIEYELKKLPQNFRTFVVKNETELKRALKQFKPDLVLSDYMMPTFDGMKALRIVRDFDPDIPFIIVTGSTNELIAAECIKAGAWDYVIKEKLGKLVPAIQMAFEKKRLLEENKKAQAALHDMANRFKALVESAPVGIIMYNAEGKIVYANSNALQLVGAKEVGQVVGQPALKFIHPTDKDLARNRMQRNLAGKLLTADQEKIVGVDGRLIYAEINARPLTIKGQRMVMAFITDITERVENERLLHLQSAALQAAANAIVITDRDGTIQWVNPAFTQLTGYAPQEAIGKNPRILKSGKQSPQFYKDLWDTILSGHVWHHEIINKRKDGSFYTEEITITPVTNGNGQITNFIAIKQDITERKQSLERFRNLIEQSNDAIYLLYNNKFEIINQRFRDLFGYTLEECNAPGFNFLNLVAPESQQLIRQRMQAVESGKKVSDVYEFTAISKSGERISCEASVSYIQYKEGVATQGIIRDITERRKAEQEIRKLSQALEQSPIAVVILNRELSIEYVNPAFTKRYGYAKEEIMGKKPFSLIFRTDESNVISEIRRTITEQKNWHGELQLKKKDGSVFFGKILLTPITNNKKETTHYLIMIEDITEKRQLQEQFLQAQKMEAIGRLAGGIAHDFNNLLTVINGYSELLLKKEPQNSPTFDKLLQIKKAGERASALTSQLLAFSRKQIVQPKILNLNHVLHELEKMLKRLIGEDIDLLIIYDKSLGLVKADPAQVEQVIMNLVVNARDAMPKGGKITIQLSNQYIGPEFVRQHSWASQGWFVLMSVTDTGIGMDKKILKHIFEPFFSTKAKGKGTGLGLATVYGIVKQSGGFVHVKSAPGEGTTFYIYWPLVNEETIQSNDTQNTKHQNLKGNETILVVEDEESVKDFIIDGLQEFGYQVRWAKNIQEAEEILSEQGNRIALVLTDVIMPGGSGAELVADLSRSNPEIKTLYMSGYTDESIVRHGILPENTHFIQKPFSVEDLTFKIREILDA